MKDKVPHVSISNKLSEAKYYLGLDEQRLIKSFISCIINKPGKKNEEGELLTENYFEEVSSDRWFTITLSEFTKFWGVEVRNYGYNHLKEILENIFKAEITIEGQKRGHKIRWISEYKYDEEEKSVSIRWSPSVIEYISQVHKQGLFNTHQLKQLVHLPSPNAFRLYELCNQLRISGGGTLQYSVEELKEILGCTGKYEDFGGFKKFIIEPNITSINKNTDIRVTLKFGKEGRKIISVIFVISFSRK